MMLAGSGCVVITAIIALVALIVGSEAQCRSYLFFGIAGTREGVMEKIGQYDVQVRYLNMYDTYRYHARSVAIAERDCTIPLFLAPPFGKLLN